MDQLHGVLYISHMRPSDHIHSYHLFGETSELTDVLHVETIKSRSESYNWQLKPHRHGRLHQVLFLTSGGGSARLDGEEQRLEAPCLVNIPRGVVHGYRFQPDTEGWVATLSSDLVDHSIRAEEGLYPPFERTCVLPLPRDLRQLAETLHREYQSQGFARAQLLRALAAALIGLVARAVQEIDPVGAKDQHNPIFTRFKALVARDFRLRRTLNDYARELAISPTHLNRVAHQATGQPASQLVTDRMLREARRMLIFTSLSAAEIAYDLGFTDPAHFSRVFSKATGQPPREFRKKMSDPTA